MTGTLVTGSGQGGGCGIAASGEPVLPLIRETTGLRHQGTTIPAPPRDGSCRYRPPRSAVAVSVAGRARDGYHPSFSDSGTPGVAGSGILTHSQGVSVSVSTVRKLIINLFRMVLGLLF